MNKNSMTDFISAQSFVGRDALCVVTGFNGQGDEQLKEAITALLQAEANHITNLVTGHVVDDNGQSPIGAKLIAQQSSLFPNFVLEEKYGRAVQSLLREWLRSDLSINLLFVEPDTTGTVPTYAWVFRGMRPNGTGSDSVERDPPGSRGPHFYEVSLVPSATTYGYIDNYDMAMVEATKHLREHPLVAPGVRTQCDTPEVAPGRLIGTVAEMNHADDLRKKHEADVGNRPQQRQGKERRK